MYIHMYVCTYIYTCMCVYISPKMKLLNNIILLTLVYGNTNILFSIMVYK